MRITLAQLNYHTGNFKKNTDLIITAIKKAKLEKSDLVVFSELAVCGYPPKDLLEFEYFVNRCEESVMFIAEECKGIAAVVGAPVINDGSNGKKLYNSALFLSDGKIQYIQRKTLLPTYDIFDEYRYFEPNTEFDIISYKGKKIAITVCEDLWYDQPIVNPFGRNKLYKTNPMDELIKFHPDFVVNISASPYAFRRGETKKAIFTENAKKFNLPIITVNQVGGQTDLIFEGGSLISTSEGDIFCELKLFEEDILTVDIEDVLSISSKIESRKIKIEQEEGIEKALILGVKDYFHKNNLCKACLGLSGGIDSAVTLVLAVKALGNENIRVLLMPSKYSSNHSVDDAVKLAENLKLKYDIIDINSSVDSFGASLSPLFENLKEDVTEENIQARIRAVLLMAVSNKFGHVLLNTSNKSEMAVGYGTLYGDMCGGISVLGDVYKTDVYKLARFMNREKEVIPWNTINKPPSAELKPGQMDSDSLPDYDILDEILYSYIELQQSVDTIVDIGFEKEIVQKIVNLVNFNEYKRYQAAPVIRISSKAFGFGRKMPLTAKF